MDAHLKAESGEQKFCKLVLINGEGLIKIGKTAEEAYKSKMVGGEKIQHEKLSHVYRNFGDFIGQDSGFREELVSLQTLISLTNPQHSNLNDINQEWKDLQKGILRQTSKRNDQLNRSLTDMAYYKKFKKFDVSLLNRQFRLTNSESCLLRWQIQRAGERFRRECPSSPNGEGEASPGMALKVSPSSSPLPSQGSRPRREIRDYLARL